MTDEKKKAYQSTWQDQLRETANKILNREKFSYDMNGDALAQQYKNQYTQQGKQAIAVQKPCQKQTDQRQKAVTDHGKFPKCSHNKQKRHAAPK